MDKNKPSYTFMFASVMVIVVAIALAGASIGLSQRQNTNIRLEKMQNILSSVNIRVERDNADDVFNQYVQKQMVLNDKGQVVEGKAAFDVDLAQELKKKPEDRLYPLYMANLEGKDYYIVPMRGKGLWGPIWGYIALEGGEKISNVYGATFDHKGETPGLGAEINTEGFQQQFIGKKIFDEEGNFKPIAVLKGGADPDDLHGVDAISGGTITSNGVTEMIRRTLAKYEPFFKSQGGSVNVPEGSTVNENASFESAVENVDGTSEGTTTGEEIKR